MNVSGVKNIYELYKEMGEEINMGSILQDFLENVRIKPYELAVKDGVEEISYKALDDLVNRIAVLLYGKIEKTDKIIPIVLDRSPLVIASMFAVWKLGFAYTIIDKAPVERLELILNQINSSVIIDDAFLSSIYDDKEIHTNDFLRDNSFDDLAAVIWTSGTTGTPKGVMLSHKNFSLMKMACFEVIDRNTDFLNISSFTVGAGQICIFLPLSAGASVHIINKDKVTDIKWLVGYILANEISFGFFPPQLAQIFLEHGDGILKTIVLSSDMASNIYSEKTEILNVYGSTETSIVSCFFTVDKLYDRVPIGKALKYWDIVLLDNDDKLITEKDSVGEICVSGNIAFGYFKDEKLTKRKFTLNTFSKSDTGKILYRTGDLAYYNQDNDLVYYSRKDFMINVHGFRVDPSEIEQETLKIDGIIKSVCVGFDASEITKIANDTRLYLGYVSDKIFYDDLIKIKLKKALPKFMIPSVIQAIDSVPLNNSGKVDRRNIIPKNIGELFQKKNQERVYIAPRNDTEKLLVKAFGEILNLDEEFISITDDFFYLGGDSLQASKLVIKINKILNKQLVYFGVFRTHRTVMSLSEFIERQDHDPVFTFNQNGNKPPLFFVHSCAGGSILYTELAKHINKDQGFYVLEFPYYEDDEILISINSVAKTYIKHMKEIVPEGPYYIGGWSMGGLIAYEIARILEENNEKCIKLYLLDPTFYNNIKMTVINDPIKNSLDRTKKKIKTLLEDGEKLEADDLKIFAHKNDLLGKSAFKYNPKSYDGDVILFKAKDSKVGRSRYNGLDDNVKNIKVVDIDEVHMRMNRGKTVEKIANIINSY
ncbi:MAG: AMP-binding protein [Methanobrevibacter sp.]|jgi:acyl-coenzyme A synthetase/AMP-(fatty) acid ligase/thioesterase domain-containing protein/acyl carrier protein|nr:AMP-binding protein [Candidatus Methanovirga basalitermitum]